MASEILRNLSIEILILIKTVVTEVSWSGTGGLRCFCRIEGFIPVSLKTGPIKGLMHVQSVEAQNPHVGLGMKFGEWGASSVVVFLIRTGFITTSRDSETRVEVRLTLEQRKSILKWYLKFENISDVQWYWKQQYGTEPPTHLSIASLRDKLDTDGIIEDMHKGRSGQQRTAIGVSNVTENVWAPLQSQVLGSKLELTYLASVLSG
ncbi:hypothetical protein TNCV_3809821 [Trichonephila clavipes]|nr:hypothetical protein TNCV_3809821 [Trichonephila clavipes]